MLDLIINQGIADGPFTNGTLFFESFTVLTIEGQPYAGWIKVHGKRFTTNLFLVDDKGNELACMYEDSHKNTLILSSRPFFPGQGVSSFTVEKHSMYEWYKISRDNFGLGSGTVEVASKDGGFVAGYTTQMHTSPEDIAKGHAPVVSVQQAGGAYVALTKHTKRADFLHGTSSKVLVSPGMDPCLVICIVVSHDRKPKKIVS
jgi:hypothetical protein